MGRRGEKESETHRQGAAYQGAFEAVFAILISAGIGYWLDGRFDTAPTFLLIGLAFGFAAFTLRVVRIGRRTRWPDPNETSENSDPRDSKSESER